MISQKVLGMLPVFELHSFLSFVKKAEDSCEMYLKRGERLFSLARDRCQRQIRDAPFGDEFDGALSIHLQPEKRDNRECLLKMRQFAGKLIDAWEKEGDETDLLIRSLTGDRIHIQRVGKGEVSDRVFPQSGNGVLPLKTTVFDEGKELLCFYSNKLYNGSMGNKVKLCTRDRASKDYYFTDDLRTVLAYCILYHSVEIALLGTEKQKKIYSHALEMEIAGHRIREAIIREQLGHVLSQYLILRNRNVSNRIFRHISTSHFPGFSFIMPWGDKEDDTYAEMLKMCGISISYSTLSQHEFLKNAQKEVDSLAQKKPEDLTDEDIDAFVRSIALYDYGLKFSKSVEEGLHLQKISSNGILPDFGDTFKYLSRFKRTAGMYYIFLQGNKYNSENVQWLFTCFYVLYGLHCDTERQMREFRESGKNHALSYQDKANIPLKTVRAMQESKLNDYFGFVEYDEDVDLEKVLIVEKEFWAVKESYFGNIEESNNAIRFRRLGNHKATGLYYPGVKCLCVDFRYPTSFIHEYGHLIDHELGELSLEPEFFQIRTLYKNHLTERLEEQPELRKIFKGKYGIGYYLTPTEIFARSFEIYCRKFLQIENDLLPQTFEGVVYPDQNEEYLDAVKMYFTKLLKIDVNRINGGKQDENTREQKKCVG